MNILLASPLPPPIGGMAHWTQQYIIYAKRLSWNVEVVNTSLIGSRASNINRKRSISQEVQRTHLIIKQFRHYFHKDFDVVHINTPCTKFGIIRDAFLTMMCKKQNYFTVVECHSNVENELEDSYFAKKAMTIALKNADRVITLNESSRRFVQQLKPIEKDKVIIAPNFVDNELVVKYHAIKPKIKKAIYVI